MRNMKTNSSTFLELSWDDELLPTGLDWGLLMVRSVPSFYLMALHGLKKIGGGPEDWQSLGKAGMNHFGIEFGHVFSAVSHHIGNETHRWLRRKYPFLLSNELFKNIVLQRASQIF